MVVNFSAGFLSSHFLRVSSGTDNAHMYIQYPTWDWKQNKILILRRRILHLHMESKLFNVLALDKCRLTFLLPPVWFVYQVAAIITSASSQSIQNWLIHWGEFISCILKFRPVTYLADGSVFACLFVHWWIPLCPCDLCAIHPMYVCKQSWTFIPHCAFRCH